MAKAARALPGGRTAAGGEQPKQKPSALVYGAAERVPASLAFLNALQHVAVMLPVLVFPLLIGLAGGLKPVQLRDLLSLSVVALGIGTLLQCFAGRYFGSGFLLTFVFTAAYLPASAEAAKSGGMALVYGMTVFAGIVELLLAQAIPRLRAFFPAEIAGLCVAEIGIILGTLGMRLMLGIDPEHAGPARLSQGTALGLGILALMVALQVWGKGMLRMLSVFIGMIAGYLISLGTGIAAHHPLADAASTVVFGLPAWPGAGLSFRTELIVPFVIGALACSLRALGDITISQKINDEHWVRPDMTTIRKGVAADGLGTIAAALLGSVGGNTYSSSVGIANASGVASRTVGYWAGGLLIVLSLMPALVGFFMHIPRPVIGAALVFTACFVLINGLQIITSRLLDARRIFVIGLSLTLSLSRDIFPEYYGTLPAILHPFVASDLVVALLVAMILNALFRIGVKRRQSLFLTPGADGPEIVRAFFEQNGRVWGARRDVIDRAIYGCDQAIEIIADYCELQGPIEIEAAFDEYNFTVSLSYNGEMLEFPERRPTEQEILESLEGIRQLGGYLLHRNADRVRSARRGDRSVLEFHSPTDRFRFLPMITFIKPLVALCAFALVAATPPGASPEGRWLTEKKNGIVEIFRCSGGNALCGRVLWFRLKPGDSNLDVNNPDPKQRSRQLCGLVFMTGFKPTDPNNWEDGRVYNSDDGNTYHATMRLQPDGTLRLHGYIVVTLIGASEIWTRHTGPLPACPGR